MAYVKEVEWKGKIYDLFDKEARVKIQNLLDTVNNMDSNKANQVDFNNYKTATDKAVKDNADNIKLLDTNKANLVQSHNLFDWSKLLSAHTSAFTVDKNEDEGYRITGTTVNKYQQILTNQKLQLDDGDYYISDSAINNKDVIVYCQIALIDTDGKSTYYNNAKVKIDNSKYTSIYLTVQVGATVGEVDTVIYPMLCKYEDRNIPYLPHKVSENIPELAKNIFNLNEVKANVIISNTGNKATSNVLTDSFSHNIKGLSLYGSSTQSTVPTPTAPVTIENVNNPNITLYRKNLFDTSKVVTSMNSKAQLIEWDRQNCSITFTTNSENANSGVYFRHTTLINFSQGYGVDYTKLNGKSVTLSFDIQSDVDCKMAVQFTKYSYTSVNISSTKQRFSVTEVVDMSKLSKAICFYLNNVEATVTISNIQIEVGSIATDYEKCNANQVSADCTLCKVNNIADTLKVNADGTGCITQNLLYERITSGASQSGHLWRYSTTSKRFYRDDTRYKANGGTPNLLCSHFEVKDNERDLTLDNSIGFTSGTGQGVAIRMLQFDGDITSFEGWLDSNEVYVLVPLANPIITELSKDEVDKILSLHTYYPNTTVISDCDCQIEYVADTKSYIDNKFKELAQVIVASADESEVI